MPTEAWSPPKQCGCSRRRMPAQRKSSIVSVKTSRQAVAAGSRAARIGTSALARPRASVSRGGGAWRAAADMASSKVGWGNVRRPGDGVNRSSPAVTELRERLRATEQPIDTGTRSARPPLTCLACRYGARGSAGVEQRPHGSGEPPRFFGLTNAESAIFSAPRVDALMAALNSDQPTSRRMKRSSTCGFARCQALRHRDQYTLGECREMPEPVLVQARWPIDYAGARNREARRSWTSRRRWKCCSWAARSSFYVCDGIFGSNSACAT